MALTVIFPFCEKPVIWIMKVLLLLQRNRKTDDYFFMKFRGNLLSSLGINVLKTAFDPTYRSPGCHLVSATICLCQFLI